MTKNFARICIMLMFLMFSYSSFAQGSKYYDYAGKFKIQFPGTPKPGSQNLDTDMGSVTLYQFILETQTAAYMVSYVDYPADQMVNQDKNALLDRAKNGFNGALKIATTDSMFMTYAKHPGILFHAEGSGMYCSMRDYLVENRLYQLGILQVSPISEQAENDFFDSFELVK